MPATITQADAQYALELVKKICDQVGPGAPCSPQERQRATIIQQELEKHLGADNVQVEEFTCAPWTFLGSLPLSATFTLAAVLLNLSMGRTPGFIPWLTAIAALAFSVAALVTFISGYIQYSELLNPLFKKKQSVNVIGALRRPGTLNVKRLLILSGHHDSAWENTWIRYLSYGMYVTLPTIMIGYLAMLVMSLLQVAGLVAGSASLVHAGTLGWVMLVYPILPAIIFAAFFNMGKKGGGTVPGAADNLSASALAVAMCRFLVANPSFIPDDTEIRFISFGCEEAGLRGSRRYVERHLDELKRLDARLLNYETVAHPEIAIITTDLGGVKNSPEMVNSLVAAAEHLGVPYKVKPSPTGAGGSDAGSFSQAGLKAINLMPFQVPQQLVAFYHQKWDRPEVLTIEPLLNVLKLSLEWLRNSAE